MQRRKRPQLHVLDIHNLGKLIPVSHFLIFPLRNTGQRVHPLPWLGTGCTSAIHFCLDQRSHVNFLVTAKGKLQWSNILLLDKTTEHGGSRQRSQGAFIYMQNSQLHQFCVCILDTRLFACLGSQDRPLISEWDPWVFTVMC